MLVELLFRSTSDGCFPAFSFPFPKPSPAFSFPFPNTEGRLKMGQCQSGSQGPLRRGQIRGSGGKANPVEVKTVRRHMSAGQETKADLGAKMPVEQRYGPVEHCVHDSSGKKWVRIPAQNYGDYAPRPPWVPSQIRGFHGEAFGHNPRAVHGRG